MKKASGSATGAAAVRKTAKRAYGAKPAAGGAKPAGRSRKK